jgi:hypothetical protein
MGGTSAGGASASERNRNRPKTGNKTGNMTGNMTGNKTGNTGWAGIVPAQTAPIYQPAALPEPLREVLR